MARDNAAMAIQKAWKKRRRAGAGKSKRVEAVLKVAGEDVDADELDRVLMSLSVEELEGVSSTMDDKIHDSSEAIVGLLQQKVPWRLLLFLYPENVYLTHRTNHAGVIVY